MSNGYYYFDQTSKYKNQNNFNTMDLRHSYNPNVKQMAQMQDTLKLEEQAFSNDILCRMLSAAECYHNRLLDLHNQPEIFGYYNGFNSGNTKNTEKLKKQFLHEIELFKSSMEDYYDNYKKYDFPNNLSEKEVINIVKGWKNNIEINQGVRSEAKYFESVIQLLRGNYHHIDYRSEIKAMNKGKVNKNGDVAYQLMYNVPYIQEKAERIAQQVRENASKGKVDIDVVLNGYYKDDDLYNSQQKYKSLLHLNNKDYNDDMDVDDSEKDEEKNRKIFNEMVDAFNKYKKNDYYKDKNKFQEAILNFDQEYSNYLNKYHRKIEKISKILTNFFERVKKLCDKNQDPLYRKLYNVLKKFI